MRISGSKPTTLFVLAFILVTVQAIHYDPNTIHSPSKILQSNLAFTPLASVDDESSLPASTLTSDQSSISSSLRGGGWIPAGYHPFGYKITPLGEQFLEFGGSLESDVGRLLAGLKQQRKTMSAIQTTWLEIVRVSKQKQSMRVYRTLQDLIDFCLAAGLID